MGGGAGWCRVERGPGAHREVLPKCRAGRGVGRARVGVPCLVPVTTASLHPHIIVAVTGGLVTLSLTTTGRGDYLPVVKGQLLAGLDVRPCKEAQVGAVVNLNHLHMWGQLAVAWPAPAQHGPAGPAAQLGPHTAGSGPPPALGAQGPPPPCMISALRGASPRGTRAGCAAVVGEADG